MSSREYVGNDLVSWDDRKALAELWQDHAPLPPGGLSDEFYAALIAIAQEGAGRVWDVLSDAARRELS